ncbi:MAG: hypothetical protein ACD_39C00697G0003 [uncultured bacterium]|nr:MAG: hypothetical protein ACD_39C00697G0003 [uncultured bacterium]
MLKNSNRLLVLFSVFAIALFCTGCCTRQPRQAPDQKFTPDPALTAKRPVAQDLSSGADETNVLSERELPEREKDRRTQELYKRLEFSFDMFQKENLDGALREVERVQMDINDDPYLEMQTWYLSAMIYHKSGKTSRRSRAMRKMLELMETLQKDPRFRESFEEGMMSQQVIDMALSKGEGRYVD